MIETLQKVQLVDGQFTPSEASDVVGSLIKVKVNFHKLQRLSICEKQHYEADTMYCDGRISELMEELKLAKEFIREARANGQNVRINGTLEISILEEDVLQPA